MTTKKLSSKQLIIQGLHVSVEGQEILKGVDLSIGCGEVHALMGPNGSGKSTLGYAVMGHPSYEITAGSVELVLLDGKRVDVLAMEPDERARVAVHEHSLSRQVEDRDELGQRRGQAAREGHPAV